MTRLISRIARQEVEGGIWRLCYWREPRELDELLASRLETASWSGGWEEIIQGLSMRAWALLER